MTDLIDSDNELDVWDFVEPCEPNCTPERHAYHQGQWDLACRINKHYGYDTNPTEGLVFIPKTPIKKDCECLCHRGIEIRILDNQHIVHACCRLAETINTALIDPELQKYIEAGEGFMSTPRKVEI